MSEFKPHRPVPFLILLPLLFLAVGILNLQSVSAEDFGPEPLPQAEPTPFGAVGACELLDGSFEICYDPMCSQEWHEPPGEQGVWRWRLSFMFRGCNPYDGCVYTTGETCAEGCDPTYPFYEECPSGDLESDDPESYPDQFPGDDPDNQEFPDPDEDQCYGIFCREAVCSEETSYFGSSQCDPSSGLCSYQYSEFCQYGCDEISGYCFGPPEGGVCVGISCDPFCEGDTSWFAGQCDPIDGGCMYSTQACDWGCDTTTGICMNAEDLNLCSSNPCASFCEGDVSYYDGECDPSDGGCFYSTVSCESGCNPDNGMCLSADQGGLCAGISCPTFCEDGVSWHDGKCDPADGQCVYYTTPCDSGCYENSGLCVPVDNGSGDLLGVLAVGGGILAASGGTAGGGYLLYRFLNGRKPSPLKPSSPTPGLKIEPLRKDVNRLSDRVDELLNRLSNIHHESLEHTIDYNQNLARIAEHKEDVVDVFDRGTQLLKKAADTGADIVGLTPGVGRTFKYGYKGVTNWVERGLETYVVDGEDAVTSLMKGYLKGNLEVAKAVIGDELGDFVPIPGVNDLGRINVRYARESVSTIIKRKGLANYGTNFIKDKYTSKAVEQGEKLIRVTRRKIR